MDNLKKNGFVIAVVVMLLILGCATYFFIVKKAMDYSELRRSVRSSLSSLSHYSKKNVDIPTEGLVKVKNNYKDNLEKQLAAGISYYKNNADKLEKLQFESGQEVISEIDEAGISTAFNTAIKKFLTKYDKERKKYLKKVYQEQEIKGISIALPKLSIPLPDLSVEGANREAARICHVTKALINSAIAAKWGGITYLNFKVKKHANNYNRPASSTPRKRPPPRRNPSSRASRNKKPIEKPIDPKSLYNKIELSVAGEMRYEDLGPFLRQLYLCARKKDNPVFFIVDNICMTKQRNRLLKPVYKKVYNNQQDAEKAADDSEVKTPAATMRINLSVVSWKGFPKKEEKPRRG